MKAGMREGGVGPTRLRAALTVAQAALSVVLLIGAGLFVRSLWNIRHLDLGIEPGRVLVGEVIPAPPTGPVSREQRADLKARHTAVLASALDAVRARPDVESAALSIGTPFETSFGVTLRVPGRDSIPALEGGGPFISAITSGYFTTVGTSLVRGRDFTVADRAGSEPVVIVNETMARTLWPGADPFEKCLIIGDQDAPPCARVVGVVEEAKRTGLRDPPAMQYYTPFGQEVGFGGTTLLVRPRGEPMAFAEDLRATLAALAPGAGYIDVATMQESLDPEIRPWRLGATMFMAFGALALLIAAVGLYSVVSVGVAQRRSEIGIRMALGARSGTILSLILRQGLALVFTGLAPGMAVAVAAGPFIASLLFDTSARDLATFTAVALILTATATIACTFPALRAARTSPLDALRPD
jgi:predicted permease